MIPDHVQKSLKSDVSDFEKSSKTTVLSSILVVSTHVHQMRKPSRKGFQNRCQSHTKSIKKRYEFRT